MLLVGCDDLLCGNEVVRRVDAPDGKHSAVLFERDCGATTGFSTQISILDAGEKPSGGGNAFIADGGRRATWGGPWADMEWLAADRLRIRHDPQVRLFKSEANVSGVAISYETAEPPQAATP